MNDMAKVFPVWIRLVYKEWEGSRKIGYTGSIQSENDLVNLLVRLNINRQLLLTCIINDKEWPVSVLDRYFEQANEVRSKMKLHGRKSTRKQKKERRCVDGIDAARADSKTIST
jgi:hypothetical protein